MMIMNFENDNNSIGNTSFHTYFSALQQAENASSSNVSPSSGRRHSPDTNYNEIIGTLLYVGIAVGILSIFINFLSLVAMRFLKDKPSADLRFLTNLSLTDMLAALSFIIIQFTPPYDINTTDVLVPVASYILRSSPWMFLTAYLLTLTSLSVNQYLAVCKPWRYSVIVTTRRTTVIIVSLWSASGLQIVVPIIIVCAQSLFRSTSSKASIGRYFAYVSAIEIQVWMSIFSLIIIVNIILNAMVYLQIRVLKRRLANRPDSENIRVKQRAFVTITYLLATGLFLWVPFPVMGIITINVEMTIDGFSAHLISVILNILLYLNCFIDPLIYGTRVMEVRRAYKDMLIWWLDCICPGTDTRLPESPNISQTTSAVPCQKNGNTAIELCTNLGENEMLI